MTDKKLLWDEWNKEHIKKHGVTIVEIEEVWRSKTIEYDSYLERKVILGKTKDERLLTIIISVTNDQRYYVISSRDMSKKERRIYYDSQKK